MNPPPTPPEEGSQCRGTLDEFPSWEGPGVGRFMESFIRFCACIGTMNQIGTPLPALSPQGGERVAEGRERGRFMESICQWHLTHKLDNRRGITFGQDGVDNLSRQIRFLRERLLCGVFPLAD